MTDIGINYVVKITPEVESIDAEVQRALDELDSRGIESAGQQIGEALSTGAAEGVDLSNVIDVFESAPPIELSIELPAAELRSELAAIDNAAQIDGQLDLDFNDIIEAGSLLSNIDNSLVQAFLELDPGNLGDVSQELEAINRDDVEVDVDVDADGSGRMALRELDDLGAELVNQFTEVAARVGTARAAFNALPAGATAAIAALGGVAAAAIGVRLAFEAVQGVQNIFGPSVDAAADLEEALNANNVVLGLASAGYQEFASESVRAVGLSEAATLQLGTTVAALLTGVGATADAAAETSESVVRLGADLGSVYNRSTEDAVLAISAALRGENEQLRSFGVTLSQAAIDSRAFELGLVEQGEAISALARQQATYNIIQEQTAAISGDFQRTADSYVNVVKQIDQSFAELSTQIGQAALPAFAAVATAVLDEIVPALGSLVEIASPVIEVLGGIGAAAVVGGLTVFAETVETLRDALDPLLVSFENLGASLGGLSDSGIDLGAVLDVISRAVSEGLTGPLEGLGLVVQAVAFQIDNLAAQARDAGEAIEFFADVIPQIPGADSVVGLVEGLREVNELAQQTVPSVEELAAETEALAEAQRLADGAQQAEGLAAYRDRVIETQQAFSGFEELLADARAETDGLGIAQEQLTEALVDGNVSREEYNSILEASGLDTQEFTDVVLESVAAADAAESAFSSYNQELADVARVASGTELAQRLANDAFADGAVSQAEFDSILAQTALTGEELTGVLLDTADALNTLEPAALSASEQLAAARLDIEGLFTGLEFDSENAENDVAEAISAIGTRITDEVALQEQTIRLEAAGFVNLAELLRLNPELVTEVTNANLGELQGFETALIDEITGQGESIRAATTALRDEILDGLLPDSFGNDAQRTSFLEANGVLPDLPSAADFGEQLQPLVDGLATAATEASTAFGENLDITGELTTEVDTVFADVLAADTQLAADVATMGMNATDGFADGLDLSTEFDTAFDGIDFETASTSGFASGLSIGQAIGDGISAGLTSRAFALRLQGIALANSISSAVRSSLGINSPSLVFTEIGEQVGDGLINGLAARTASVQAQAAQLGNATTAGTTSAITNNANSTVNNNVTLTLPNTSDPALIASSLEARLARLR